jgi:protease-4
MKDFFKHVGATVVGIFIFTIVIAALGIMSVVGMVASSEATKKIDDNSVLVLKLDGTMDEQGTDNIMNEMNNVSGLSFEKTMEAIRKAKNNDNIKGIYIEAGALGADLAQVQEIRAALQDFKKSHKWIIAYGEEYSTLSYYLASVADKVLLNKQGTIDWHGIGGEVTYWTGLFDKFGIKFVPIKVGKYKSAVESVTLKEMSPADREQTERYINGWWSAITGAVSESRHISKADLNAYADRLITYEAPENFVKTKMVDALVYNDDVKDEVKKLMKLGKYDDINKVSISDMGNVKEVSEGDDEIAVYYAYGEIVDEASTGSIFASGHQIVSKDICKDLTDLADDDDVKAVVLRINSGGGSAYASEQIWHQIMQLRKKKPVVVSMSGAAASGGYYMSSAANWIVADPSTITGSIGIFGLFVDRSELFTKKLGLTYSELKTNRNSTIGAQGHPFTPEQMSILQNNVSRGYNLFKSRVAQGRNMTMAQVENIAQGRVWLGEDALKIKLVDELGGIDKAIAKAAKLAKTNSYYTYSYPEEESIWQQIMNSRNSDGTILDAEMKNVLGEYYEPFKVIHDLDKMDKVQTRVPYIIKIK